MTSYGLIDSVFPALLSPGKSRQRSVAPSAADEGCSFGVEVEVPTMYYAPTLPQKGEVPDQTRSVSTFTNVNVVNETIHLAFGRPISVFRGTCAASRPPPVHLHLCLCLRCSSAGCPVESDRGGNLERPPKKTIGRQFDKVAAALFEAPCSTYCTKPDLRYYPYPGSCRPSSFLPAQPLGIGTFHSLLTTHLGTCT